MNSCRYCGGNTTNPKFCSLSCGAKDQMQQKRKLAKAPTKVCEYCDIEFEIGTYSGTTRTNKTRFCSRSCSASLNNQVAVKRVSDNRKDCALCGQSFIARSDKNIFCSQLCRKQLREELFLSGDSEVACCKSGVTQWARELLIQKANNSCSKCGWDGLHPVDSLPLVEIDHIDGNHRNNHIDNLQVLCPNCHSMTPNHRARNKGNGRESRRNEEE